MGEVFPAKLRRIGSSVGVIIPKERLAPLKVEVGDEVEVALLKHPTAEEIKEGFGMARKFTEPFQRDKKVQAF